VEVTCGYGLCFILMNFHYRMDFLFASSGLIEYLQGYGMVNADFSNVEYHQHCEVG
jgi:hypothetical protein